MHFITERILVGNINDASEPPPQISAVLLVAAEFTIKPPSWLAYGKIPFSEYAEAEPLLLDRAVSWVEQHLSDNRVMVCCRAGMSRSVSVVMTYLCCVQGMPYADVLKLVMTRRPGAIPLPNLEKAIAQVSLLREARATDNERLASRRAAGL
ncbi:MAG: dual specificity protein phosphatase family protein [Nitrospira sp.]|nr:dual specificity protein phosphatase family protein [Nitrospira sp.]